MPTFVDEWVRSCLTNDHMKLYEASRPLVGFLGGIVSVVGQLAYGTRPNTTFVVCLVLRGTKRTEAQKIFFFSEK